MFRRALLCFVILFATSLADSPPAQSQQSARPAYLPQGWSPWQRKSWYGISQGSRLLPRSWMRALEVAQDQTKFLSPANMSRMGFLPGRSGSDLPHGFVVDSSTERGFGGPAVGMTCAACHTGELRLKGKAVRIDGGPSLADYEAFMAAFLASLKATHDTDDKFKRFSAAVLGQQNTAGARATLKSDLGTRVAWHEKLARHNASATPYGHGRLDAQGHILNKIALVTGADQTTLLPPDAPVSYPHIWNAHQHDRVQWNGLLPHLPSQKVTINGRKADIGALARNVGEVLGVFAEIDVRKDDWEHGFRSSVRVENLVELERLLSQLQSPRWPTDLLGRVKGDVKRGADLFHNRKLKDYSRSSDATATCAQCHQRLRPDDTRTPFKAQMQPVAEAGTDMWSACNAVMHKANAGNMTGRFENGLPAGDSRVESNDSTIKLLRNAIIGSVVYKYEGASPERWKSWVELNQVASAGAAPATPASTTGGAPSIPSPAEIRERRRQFCIGLSHSERPDARLFMRYKGRPLNGIWATAPYLHNGSVLTLYDLLLPATKRGEIEIGTTKAGGAPRLRRDTFHVGSRDFDPVEVGLKSEPGQGRSEFRVRSPDGKELYGNSNAGHEWGAAELSDEERWAIVAYLKTL
jgi:cytochrome c553